ncbi:hypothetical protein KR018_000118, partial [Drosophila ironensis]
LKMAEIEQENGAGALKIKSNVPPPPPPPPSSHKQSQDRLLALPVKEREESREEILTPRDDGATFASPPPPPPPTPVQAPAPTTSPAATSPTAVASPQAVQSLEEPEEDEANSEKWEDPCAPPPPPPLPGNAYLAAGLGYLKLPAVKLKDALEKAITKLEANRKLQKASHQVGFAPQSRDCSSIELLPRRSGLGDMCDDVPILETSSSTALMEHPLTNKPDVIVQLERHLKVVSLLAKQNRTIGAISREPIPMHAAEDEGLTLQVLSARASTPYTQPTSMLSCTAVSCDLDHDSPKKQLAKAVVVPELAPQPKRAPIITSQKPGSLRAPKATRHIGIAPAINGGKGVKHYARSHLMDIRNAMFNALMHRSKESFVMPRIATCDDIELEARLRRMNLWRTSDGTRFRARPTTNSSAMSNSNECMPAFFKNKNKQLISDESIIQSQPPQPQTEFQDPAIVNQRRIGSGRFNHSKWGYNDYNPTPTYNNGKSHQDELNPKHQSSNMTVMQFFDNGEISSSRPNSNGYSGGRPNTPVMGMSNNRSDNDTVNSNESSEDLSRANENYVKRVMSGFLVVSKPKSRDNEEKHHRRYRNQSEEPEWFSCGPTSRLDTIELCGFDEDEEKMLKEGHNTHSAGEMERDVPKHKMEQNKYKWTHSESVARNKFMPKHDSNNNQNVENMNKILGSDQQPSLKEDKRAGGGRSNQHQNGYDNGNYANHQQQHQHQAQQQAQPQHNNSNNSKFMSFFARERNTSSSSLNEFFKQAMSQGHANTGEQPKSLGHMNQMPSVEQLEAKWRRNSVNSAGEIAANKQADNFQKLIGSLGAIKPQAPVQPPVVGSEAISTFILQQQHYQQQQQKQHILIQQQQQQTAFLAGLQLKAILGRADTQMLLLRLTKGSFGMHFFTIYLLRLCLFLGEISKHGLLVQLANPRLTNMDREAITAVLQFTNTQQQQQQHQQQLDMLSSTVIASQLQNLHNLAIVQQTLATRQAQQQQQQQQQHVAMGPPQQLSQEDLQAHANVIMRNAVMKRKIEEQTSKLISAGAKLPQQQAAAQLSRAPHRLGRDDTPSNALLQAIIAGSGNTLVAANIKPGQQAHYNNRRSTSDANQQLFAESQNFQSADSGQSHFPAQYKPHYQQPIQQQHLHSQ